MASLDEMGVVWTPIRIPLDSRLAAVETSRLGEEKAVCSGMVLTLAEQFGGVRRDFAETDRPLFSVFDSKPRGLL